MRIYLRARRYWVRFTTPGGEPRREPTGCTELRAAERAARAIVESAARDWSHQEELFGSRDRYPWEVAVVDWHRERMLERIAPATLEIDGQNLRYLAAAHDGAGRKFFAGRLLREIDGPTILGYVEQQRALGLTAETITIRLCTLRKVLASAAARLGSDKRPLLSGMPPIPKLGRSRAADGWGRALSMDEFERLAAALPATGEVVRGSGDARGNYRPSLVVDQRGWVEICVWTAQHASDVNDFCPRHVNLPAGTFVHRNTKNRRRTQGRIKETVVFMPPQLRDVVARLRAVRGWEPDQPIAGYWTEGHRSKALREACLRAGIEAVTDDRGRRHFVSANDLRRTAATWIAEEAVRSGTGPDKSATEVIADWLHHSGLDVARNIYDRAKGARQAAAAEILGRLARRPPLKAPPPPGVIPMLDYLKRKA